MSTSNTDKRIDPLIDAYRQASELEAQTTGARPSAALRAAVLAHARVVAQSATTSPPKLAVNEAVLATPAANESRPVWRMVAGVVLGLAGMWVYQLTRSGTTGEANVAVMSAPQSAKSVVTESANSPDSSVAPVAPGRIGAASTATPTTSASAKTGGPAQQETTVAIAATQTTASPASPAMTPVPSNAAGINAGAKGLRDSVADAARSDTSIALAKVDAPAKRAEQSAPVAAATAVTAAATAVAAAAAAPPAAATSSTSTAIPEVPASEPFRETIVASAETRKAARQGATARPSVAGATAESSPNAFPATASGAMVAAAPPPAAPAASAQSSAAGGSAAMRQGVLSSPDAAMFSAIRIGNVNALRAALARGANVNARDETGRSALQIARERSDTAMLTALEMAGAK